MGQNISTSAKHDGLPCNQLSMLILSSLPQNSRQMLILKTKPLLQ